MKRSLVLGLGAIALASLFPNMPSQANYDYAKNTSSKNIQYEKIEQKITREEKAKSVLEQTTWDEKINGTMTINYPKNEWGSVVYYDPKRKAIQLYIVAPENATEEYIRLFNKAVDQYKQEEKEIKQKKKGKKNARVLRMEINSKKTDLDPEVNIEYYETEILDTPLPNWTITVKDYITDNLPPKIDIQPNDEDAYMLLDTYKAKKAEHEKSQGKVEF